VKTWRNRQKRAGGERWLFGVGRKDDQRKEGPHHSRREEGGAGGWRPQISGFDAVDGLAPELAKRSGKKGVRSKDT